MTPKAFTILGLSLFLFFLLQAAPPGIAAASARPHHSHATGPTRGALFEADPERAGLVIAQVAPAPVPETKREEEAPENGSGDSGLPSELCTNRLGLLRELFLKARRFASQRAACDLAESAAAFLRTIELCKSDCPPQSLEQNGFTQRVIRHMTSLGKIGRDQCRGVNGPPEPLPAGPPGAEATPPAHRDSP
jgi:hypothetical protein